MRNFQMISKPEFLLEHGQLDKVVHRKEMKETLAQLLKLHQEVKKDA